MNDEAMRVRQYVSRLEVTDEIRRELVACWLAVTNEGGAAGFPFPPVSEGDIATAVDDLVSGLHLDRRRLLVVSDGHALLGWGILHRSTDRLIAHWGSLHHVQSHPEHQDEGVGSLLVRAAHRIARDELELEQLRLATRAGMGMEEFYARLGWREVGRWPAALRLGPEDDRDEVLMHIQLR